MKRKRFQWMFVLVLGVLLPGALFSVMERLPRTPRNLEVCIPVLMDSGKVESVELEAYLVGVLAAAMPEEFHMEALKAQAVAARTLAARIHLAGEKHDGAVCTDEGCCQGYDGRRLPLSQRQKLRQAVRETAGQVLTYEDALIRALHFSCSGGKTESARDVWGENVPYLQSISSPGEEASPCYMTTLTMTAEQFASKLTALPAGLPGQWIGPITYTDGGGVATVRIGEITYSGIQLRQLLGLNSTAFVLTIVGDTVTVTAKGAGHRVGMSRYGAQAMALQGSSYAEILACYYGGCTLTQEWNLSFSNGNV